MKHIKNIELFERAITKKIISIGDFLFEKFFDINRCKIIEKLFPEHNIYRIIIEFSTNRVFLCHYIYVVDYVDPQSFMAFRPNLSSYPPQIHQDLA